MREALEGGARGGVDVVRARDVGVLERRAERHGHEGRAHPLDRGVEVVEGRGLQLGRQRVLNTPISESAVCGVAVGAAQSGLKPVVEIMFIDFITLALDQLVNQAAKAHFMSGGQL